MKNIPILILALLSFAGFTQTRNLLVGTYTEDIHLYRFDTRSGNLSFVCKLAGVKSPSYLAISGNSIYSVSESGAGAVAAIRLENDSLRLLNQVPSEGADPCYIDVYNEWVVVANYTGGNFSLFRRSADGSLSQAVQTVNHAGSSVNRERQNEPHTHFAHFSKDGKAIWVNDLGTDKTYVYPFKKGVIEIATVVTIDATAGAGPRHAEFNGEVTYILNEMNGTVDVIRAAERVQQISPKLKAENGLIGIGSADIHMSPNGKFLYASHRGISNAITTYSIAKDGSLTLVDTQDCAGENPRNFVIDPSGRFLLVANGKSNNIAVFAIDSRTGRLTKTVQYARIEKPVCLKFQ